MSWSNDDERNWSEFFERRFGPRLPEHVLAQTCPSCGKTLTWQKNVRPDGSLIYKAWCCATMETHTPAVSVANEYDEKHIG